MYHALRFASRPQVAGLLALAAVTVLRLIGADTAAAYYAISDARLKRDVRPL